MNFENDDKLKAFLNEYDLIIDRENILKLINENKNLKISETNEIIYFSNEKTFELDLAKYIQIISKITD